MARVLLIASRRAYQIDDFVAAASELGVEVIVATDQCHGLRDVWPPGTWAMKMRKPAHAASTIVAYARATPLDGIVPTDERTAVIAAIAGQALGLRANDASAARIAGNKRALRDALLAAGLAQPRSAAVDQGDDLLAIADELGYPVVIKPLHLSASRGVMRADDPDQLAACAARLRRLLAEPDLVMRDKRAARQILVEQFVPGPEVAFEGVLAGGALQQIAIFDKPEPLDGPFFAETIYVTPSQHAPELQRTIRNAVAAAARAIGLTEGPVHAELRLGDGRAPVVLEVAARSIGGLCSRTLRYGAGVSLEALIINHAVGHAFDPSGTRRAPSSGVAMLPVPAAGFVRGVAGVDDAKAIAGVVDVVITARIGDAVRPLPEGDAYLGFVFATGASSHAVCELLRRARAALKFRIAPSL